MFPPLTPTDCTLYTTVGLLFYYLMVHKHKRDKALDVFPGPTRPPVVGHTLDLVFTRTRDMIPKMMRWCDEHGPVVKIFGGGWRFLLLCDSGHVEKVVALNEGGFEYEFIRCLVGRKGCKSSHRTRLIRLAFQNKVESSIPVFNSESFKLVEIMKRGCGDDVCPYVSSCVLDIVFGMVMGEGVRCQDGENLEYLRAVREVVEVVRSRGCRPDFCVEWLWGFGLGRGHVKVIEEVCRVTDSVIQEGKRRRSEGKGGAGEVEKNTLLDHLLDAQARDTRLTDQDIREETLAVLIEGYGAACRLVLGAVYALGCYPDVQEKLRNELTSIFGNNKTRPVTIEDLCRMKYLDCVVREVLRMYGSVPVVQTYLAEDLEIDENVRIPGDVTVGLFLYKMHRDPEYFPEPGVFRPERFSERGSFVYVPSVEWMVVGKVVLVNLVRGFVVGEVGGLEEMNDGLGCFGSVKVGLRRV